MRLITGLDRVRVQLSGQLDCNCVSHLGLAIRIVVDELSCRGFVIGEDEMPRGLIVAAGEAEAKPGFVAGRSGHAVAVAADSARPRHDHAREMLSLQLWSQRELVRVLRILAVYEPDLAHPGACRESSRPQRSEVSTQRTAHTAVKRRRTRDPTFGALASSSAVLWHRRRAGTSLHCCAACQACNRLIRRTDVAERSSLFSDSIGIRSAHLSIDRLPRSACLRSFACLPTSRRPRSSPSRSTSP